MADSTLTVQGLTEALRRRYYGISYMDRNAPRIAAFAWSWLHEHGGVPDGQEAGVPEQAEGAR